MNTRVSLVISMGALLSLAGAAAAQRGPSAGTRDTTPKKVQMLFVQSAQSASLANGKLTLTGVSPTTVFFSDRPNRIAGHMATPEIVPLWSEGSDSFLKDPPNATISTFDPAGKVMNAVVELRNPQLNGNQLTFDVRVLQGQVSSNAQGASLFIDIIGMPLTPLSFAGVYRRQVRRAVIFGY